MAQRAPLVAGVPAQVLAALLPRDEGRAARRGDGGVRRLPPLPISIQGQPAELIKCLTEHN